MNINWKDEGYNNHGLYLGRKFKILVWWTNNSYSIMINGDKLTKTFDKLDEAKIYGEKTARIFLNEILNNLN